MHNSSPLTLFFEAAAGTKIAQEEENKHIRLLGRVSKRDMLSLLVKV